MQFLFFQKNELLFNIIKDYFKDISHLIFSLENFNEETNKETFKKKLIFLLNFDHYQSIFDYLENFKIKDKNFYLKIKDIFIDIEDYQIHQHIYLYLTDFFKEIQKN